MSYAPFPSGSGLGRDASRRKPGLVDYEWTMTHGSRAQRREILRSLQAAKRAGHHDAAQVLDDFRARFVDQHQTWRISIPGRSPFIVVCVQGATAAEMQLRYPDGTVEVVE